MTADESELRRRADEALNAVPEGGGPAFRFDPNHRPGPSPQNGDDHEALRILVAQRWTRCGDQTEMIEELLRELEAAELIMLGLTLERIQNPDSILVFNELLARCIE